MNSSQKFEGLGKQPKSPATPRPETIIPPMSNGSEISDQTLKILGIPDSSKISEAIKKGLENGTLVDITPPPHSPED